MTETRQIHSEGRIRTVTSGMLGPRYKGLQFLFISLLSKGHIKALYILAFAHQIHSSQIYVNIGN